MPILKINYAFLVPLIVLSIPSIAIFQQTITLLIITIFLGLAGMLTGRPALVTSASTILIILLVWGKIASDIYGLNGTDTALLLLQFMTVIFLMEASKSALTFDTTFRRVVGKTDEMSVATQTRVTEWMRAQLLGLGSLTLAATGLSLSLLVLAGLVSVPVNQLAFSGVLVLVAVVAILVLLTYRREPESRTLKG